MPIVPPKEVPLNLIPIFQGIAPTDYILVNNGTLGLVPWGNIIITAEQTDFYSTIESISSAQIDLTASVVELSATVDSGKPNWDSSYTTVNALSTGWTSAATTTLNIVGYISNSSIGYTGSLTPLTNPIVIGFNGSYGLNKIVNINNTDNYVTSFTDNASLYLKTGTYKISGSVISTSSAVTIGTQFCVAFYSSLPTVGNNKSYSASNTPVATVYSTVGYNVLQNVHFIDSYVYVSSPCYALVLFTNTDASISTNTGVGTNVSLSLFGGTPKYGGTIDITYLSSTNFLNITGTSSVVGVRPTL